MRFQRKMSLRWVGDHREMIVTLRTERIRTIEQVIASGWSGPDHERSFGPS